MNKNLKNIIEKVLGDEVDINYEWGRMLSTLLTRDIDSLNNKSRKRRFLQIFKYIAAVFIGICCTTAILYAINSYSYSKDRFFIVNTQKSEKSSVKLPDGTIVWLNASTKIEYSKDYGEKNRDIFLCGEAYFEVAKNADLPFIVKVGELEVTALGTTFNISAYPEDNELITTLFTGKVSIEPILTKQQVILGPKSVAIYYKDINKIEAMPYSENHHAQWKIDYFTFEMTSLANLSKTLEQKYNVVFIFENEKIKNMKFSGSLKNSQSLIEILKIIQINTAIKYQIKNDSVIIK